MGALWYEASTNICRRCRFYGTWHCLGQGMLVSRMFPRIDDRLGESGTILHGALLTAFFAYGLFWLWHEPVLGFIFTLWVPIALVTATAPAGFSWRALKPS
jgi:Na+/melibiose symporter-like transporter